jgi:hypothetical protein
VLAEHQVRHLLDEGERRIGRRLDGIRGQLRSESNVRSAIWELVVIDAFSAVGAIDYERKTGMGKTPDLHVETQDCSFWVEAAFLHPRFADIEKRQDAFRRAVWNQERQIGIPAGTLSYEFYGERAAFGYDVRIPAQHKLADFFKQDLVRNFFESIKANPTQGVQFDLGEVGATVRLGYVPGHAAHGGGGPMIEAPHAVEEHGLYRLLVKKAKKYKVHDLRAPLILCVTSERSTAVRRMGSPNVVSPEAAIEAAYRKYPILSAVFVISLEHPIPVPGNLSNSRRVYVRGALNQSATYPLSREILDRLQTVRFDKLDYGHGWNEREGITEISDRMARLGGSLMVHGGLSNEGFAVTLPAHEIVHVLSGKWSADEWQKNYRLTDGENPFRRAAREGRPIIAVELLPHNPRDHEPQKIKISFGPPTPLLLQNPKT